MNESRTTAIQLCPISDYLETCLAARFEVIRWFDLSEAERVAFLAERAAAVRAVITGGHVGCSNELLKVLPSLGIVAINGVGTDKVDLEFARTRGVRVTTTPGALTEDVADLAIGLTIALLRGIPAADAHVRAGRWPQGDRPLGRKVSGRRFGIVGLGQIGSAIARRLAAFGPVAYTDTRPQAMPYEFHDNLLSLARSSDVLVVACPANAATRRLINGAVIDALGPNGYLINVARGSIVDEPVLIAALAEDRLAGAALDVFEDEPNVPEALRTSARVVLTPHIASATLETRMRMADLVLKSLDDFFAGAPLLTAAV
jgi:lactate dehydrogenase-like 2-hydroxyacid dehydrogenase